MTIRLHMVSEQQYTDKSLSLPLILCLWDQDVTK